MNQPFIYVEDYIEFIAGWRTGHNKLLAFFENVPSPLSLARYDVKIVESLGIQTALDNRPYTDKQAELAKKIVFKYKRQLANLDNPIIVPDNLGLFRLGVRQIDRTKSASVQEGEIWLRFPYDTELINKIKSFVRLSEGKLQWDSSDKVWKAAITEYNINLIVALGKEFEFTIDDELLGLYERILECEKHTYRIQLTKVGNKYTITNADESLVQFLEHRIGENCWTDLVCLCDYAEVCGYTISTEVKNELTALVKLDVVRQLILYKKFGVAEEELPEVLEYARMVNRLPLYFYSTEPVTQKNTNDIIYLNGRTKYPDNNFIPLLVTSSPLMIGGRRQSWLQNSEKVIDLI